MDGHAVVANVQELALLDLAFCGDDDALAAHAPGNVGVLVRVMEEIDDGQESMRLVDVHVVVVFLVVVDPRAFTALGPEEVGNRKDLLVLLEYVFRVRVIFFEEIGEVMLRFEIDALEYIPDIMIAPHNRFSITLQALCNRNMMLLHKPNMIHRHVIEVLGQQLEVQPLRIGPLILLLVLRHKCALYLRDKLVLKNIEQVQLLKRIKDIPLHCLPISREKRDKDVSI